MPWGLFKVYEKTTRVLLEIHVTPCTDDLYIKPPHSNSPHCPCCPQLDPNANNTIPVYIHNHIN